MARDINTPEGKNILLSTIKNARTGGSSAKTIKQNRTELTAQFIVDKMNKAGQDMVGKTYTVEQAHEALYNNEGLRFKATDMVSVKTNNPEGVKISFKKNKGKLSTLTQWRPYYLEKVFTDNLASHLRKGPTEGFVLLKPKNPLKVGSAKKQLAKWYDPILNKTYDEEDWATRADAFVPELKTAIEVKTREVTFGKKNPPKQNKGLNQDFTGYDGMVGYAILDVMDQRKYTDAGMDLAERKRIAKNLGLSLTFAKGSNAEKYNAKVMEKLIGSMDFVFSTRVVANQTTMYSVENASKYIRGILQKLGLESGKPLGGTYLENVDASKYQNNHNSLINLLTSYLVAIVTDDNMFGIPFINEAITGSNHFRADVSSAISRGIEDPEAIIKDVLLRYMQESENVDMVLDVAQSIGKPFINPTITMTNQYADTQQAPLDTLLGTGIRL